MTPKLQLPNLIQAIEAHFADVDILGIRQGNDRVVTTTIYIDNAKTLSITSTKSGIAVCKIYDLRIKAILNCHSRGMMFLNSKFSHMFGYDQAVITDTITELIYSAIPGCANDRIVHKVRGVQKYPYLLFTYILTYIYSHTSFILVYLIELMYTGGPMEDKGWTIFWVFIGLSIILIAISHYTINKHAYNRALLIKTYLVSFIIYTILFCISLYLYNCLFI